AAPGGMRSFLQAVSTVTEEAPTPLRVVQMEGLAVLKIIKHCEEFAPALVTGQLLGLDVGSVLEVTNCFPFPIREEDDEADADGANYQLEMMRCLREVNVDNNTIGWYQSCLLGSFQTVELIETFMNYQIKVSNSALVSAFMKELEPESPVTQCDFDRLKLSTAPFMERNLEFLIGCMDDLSSEQNKFQYYYRNVSRQQSQQQAWLQKRRQENMARKAAGEEPLPEEDPSNPIFKPIPEPSRLEGYLVTNQISSYCNHINGVAGQNFNRLYLMKALHEN
ncbi:Eukaryotic translation initiation factor 3 subunit H, partial [Dichanthelium oligosanthes]